MSIPVTDQRYTALTNWLQHILSLDVQQITTASSDASFRRYFRVRHNGGCHIVMDAPPDKEKTEPFIRVARLFTKAGLNVPQIHEINSEQGFLLLEDFGSTCLYDELSAETVDRLYQPALDSLFRLQSTLDITDCGLAAYDAALLNRELEIFHEWFLEKRLDIVLPATIKNTLHELLINSALEQPQVCVHRDYHSRNLMLLVEDEDSLGIIDFQDAVVGPISYDLVSLLRDCYKQWPSNQVLHWLHAYYQRLTVANLVDVEFELFKRWFDLMGMQRHLKAIGIFSRLDIRDGKSGYLADIPRTLGYVTQICNLYPELLDFNNFLKQQVMTNYQVKL